MADEVSVADAAADRGKDTRNSDGDAMDADADPGAMNASDAMNADVEVALDAEDVADDVGTGPACEPDGPLEPPLWIY
ncbi:MAG: hypothetical protein ACJAYU_000408 [Bradymonadia bacterium]